MNLLSKSVFGLIILFFLSGKLIGQTISRECQLRKLEKEWTTLLDKKDTSALKNIWMDNYVVNNAVGKIVGVKDILVLIKNGHVFPKVERSVERITFQGPLAIVMGAEKEFASDGKVKNRRFTNLWIEQKDGWKLLARQATGQ
ncbi:nuclear transport factor 2 family protein [Sphingobacterium bambusae]|uniref:Nuclear transport factor 2 family protein n=1 Tax=Sphingobacterium bambusae TaxID=662858 RepID=A0ABW6BGR8_9SPHI|nr:nuclear transport factor 2 family protein [Sphingobacterium bambusae]WPL49468.1 nuclear transport factor 2 family protein [Sphingobacterium bambusae]